MNSADHKSIYQSALNINQSIECLDKALNNLLRLAFTNNNHFDFLLHHINWFDEPFIHHIHILQKALRVFKGQNKQSLKVIYNILADGMLRFSPTHVASSSLSRILKTGYDSKALKLSLYENYPYKANDVQIHLNYIGELLEIYRNFEGLGVEIVEIIVVELASFDTELCEGDHFCVQTFPSDSQIQLEKLKLAKQSQHNKFDSILTELLQKLQKTNNWEKLFKELLVVFKNHLVIIQNTKYIQFILYYFTELTNNGGKSLVAFLLGQIIDKVQAKNNRKILVSLNDYLSSYVCRSKSLNAHLISKTLKNLIKLINCLVSKKKQNKVKENENRELTEVDEQNLRLGQIYDDNFQIILLLQTVIRIWIYRQESHQTNYDEFIKLLEECKTQIHFQYFIRHDLLDEIKIISFRKGSSGHKTIPICHKFNPPLLKNFSFYVDEFIRPFEQKQKQELKLEVIKSEIKIENQQLGAPCKKLKKEKQSLQNAYQSYQ